METNTHKPIPKLKGVSAVRRRYTGEVVYVYAYDVAYELTRQPITELLGQKVVPFGFDSSRRHPRHHFFYKPQMIRLPAMERVGPGGPVKLERIIKLLPVGAISITVRIPFEVDRLEDLVAFHDLHFDTGSLNLDVRLLAESVHRELAPYCIRPNPSLVDEEAYTVFCLDAPLTTDEGQPMTAEQWMQAHRRQVAALLTQETDINLLVEAGVRRIDRPLSELLPERSRGHRLGCRALRR